VKVAGVTLGSRITLSREGGGQEEVERGVLNEERVGKTAGVEGKEKRERKGKKQQKKEMTRQSLTEKT